VLRIILQNATRTAALSKLGSESKRGGRGFHKRGWIVWLTLKKREARLAKAIDKIESSSTVVIFIAAHLPLRLCLTLSLRLEKGGKGNNRGRAWGAASLASIMLMCRD
jgi:hypothetical protein